MFQDFKEQKKGNPVVPAEIPSARESFLASDKTAGLGLFDHADLKSVFEYLRGGRGLKIPEEWKNVIPRSL